MTSAADLAEGDGIAPAEAECFVVLALAIVGSFRCPDETAAKPVAGGILPFQGLSVSDLSPICHKAGAGKLTNSTKLFTLDIRQ